ncbi:MAG: Rieske (2Fe-2S) protein [Rudanella sp.]|nr:Rieske (2Fe-2S) protein [Rudanella sp.]
MQSESLKTAPTVVNRAEFLRNLGLSTSALMALYCMGTLTSCSKADDPAPLTPTPTPGSGTSTGLTGNIDKSKGVIDFTLDLTNTNYSRLKTEGEFVQVGEIVVANTKDTLVALTNVCTHQSGQLQYRKATNDFECNVHQGQFNLDGTVKKGPPTKAVGVFKTALTGNNLRVTA